MSTAHCGFPYKWELFWHPQYCPFVLLIIIKKIFIYIYIFLFFFLKIVWVPFQRAISRIMVIQTVVQTNSFDDNIQNLIRSTLWLLNHKSWGLFILLKCNYKNSRIGWTFKIIFKKKKKKTYFCVCLQYSFS